MKILLIDKYLLNTIVLSVLISICTAVREEVPDAVAKVNRLSDQVRQVLEHYKSPNPVGIPGFPFPDPLQLEEIQHSVALGTLTLKNQYVHGISKFKIESVYSNLADLVMYVAIRMDQLQVLGNYSYSSLFSTTKGASNVTFIGVYIEGSAQLTVAKEGYLEASDDLDMDMSVLDIKTKFENTGLLGTMVQGAMNTVGSLIIDSIKPFIIKEVKSKMLTDVNKNLRGFKDFTFPNSLLPLDMCIWAGRELVRQKGYDPFMFQDFTYNTGVFGLNVSDIWIYGLSSFYRIGNITVEMENNTVYMSVSAGTQELSATCDWELSLAGLLSTTGKIMYDIEYIEGQIRVNQSLDTRKKPNLEHLEITLGNFQLQFDGAGTFDFLIEAVLNILPNLLRNQIIIAFQDPLKIKIQEIFNEINVEKEIMSRIESFEKDKHTNNNTSDVLDNPLLAEQMEGLTINASQLDDSIF